MDTHLIIEFSIDREKNKINVKREFAAPVSKVWAAWTRSEILDKWWAPKPYKVKTKSMDFREGGYWLYAMVGPQGEENWAKIDYLSITPERSFIGFDSFCDSEGHILSDMPRSNWTVSFSESGTSTLVNIDINYDKLADLEKYIEMGFREGLAMVFENLDELLEKQ